MYSCSIFFFPWLPLCGFFIFGPQVRLVRLLPSGVLKPTFAFGFLHWAGTWPQPMLSVGGAAGGTFTFTLTLTCTHTPTCWYTCIYTMRGMPHIVTYTSHWDFLPWRPRRTTSGNYKPFQRHSSVWQIWQHTVTHTQTHTLTHSHTHSRTNICMFMLHICTFNRAGELPSFGLAATRCTCYTLFARQSASIKGSPSVCSNQFAGKLIV